MQILKGYLIIDEHAGSIVFKSDLECLENPCITEPLRIEGLKPNRLVWMDKNRAVTITLLDNNSPKAIVEYPYP